MIAEKFSRPLRTPSKAGSHYAESSDAIFGRSAIGESRLRRTPHHGADAEHLVPLYDRNPQKFVSIFSKAKKRTTEGHADDYRSKQYPSNIEVMVLSSSPVK